MGVNNHKNKVDKGHMAHKWPMVLAFVIAFCCFTTVKFYCSNYKTVPLPKHTAAKCQIQAKTIACVFFFFFLF